MKTNDSVNEKSGGRHLQTALRKDSVLGIEKIKEKTLLPSLNSIPPQSRLPARKEYQFKGAENKPRIPSVKTRRIVFQRAQGCCEYIHPSGTRCKTRYKLQFDHVIPYSLNGSSDPENMRLLCAAHNLYAASQKNIGFETTTYFSVL